MDRNTKRKYAMAIKSCVLILASCFVAMSSYSNQITNVDDIIGIPLSSNIWERIPIRDRTTPDNVFLGGIRSLLLGNAADVKFYFTDDLWSAATGLDPDTIVSDAQAQNFRNAICDGCISNQVLISFSRTTTNDMYVINSTITDNIGNRVSTNGFKLVFVFTNSVWRISDLFLDGTSVRSDEEL